MNAASITNETLSLPVQQRAELAAQLLSSLDTLSESESEIEPLWFQEAARRAAEMDQGLSKRIPSDEVRCEENALLQPAQVDRPD